MGFTSEFPNRDVDFFSFPWLFSQSDEYERMAAASRSIAADEPPFDEAVTKPLPVSNAPLWVNDDLTPWPDYEGAYDNSDEPDADENDGELLLGED